MTTRTEQPHTYTKVSASAMERENEVKDAEPEDLEEKEVELKVDELSPVQKLFHYARTGDCDAIRSWKQTYPSVSIDSLDEGRTQESYASQNTALHYACQSGHLDAVKLIFNFEAQIETANKLASTPLHIAAAHGQSSVVQFLVNQHAKTNQANCIGNTPLHCAVYSGDVATVKVLLSVEEDGQAALKRPNGVGVPALKYVAHQAMKEFLASYLPKEDDDADDNADDDADGDVDDPPHNSNGIVEIDAPPQ